MRTTVPGLVLLGCSLMPFQPAQAQDRVVNPHVSISLVPGSQVAAPGALPAALVFEVEEGWHIYWQNAGESGIATSAYWQLPPGWKVDSLTWPVPERYDVAGVTTHIHRGIVALGTRLVVPPGWRSEASIRVDLVYGICRELCLPGKASLSLSLPPGASSPLSSEWHAVRTLIENRAPRLDGPTVSAQIQDSTLVLTLRGRNGAALTPGSWTFFPADRLVAHAAVTGRLRPGAGQLTLRLRLADCTPVRLNGVLVQGDAAVRAPRGYAVSLPLTRWATC